MMSEVIREESVAVRIGCLAGPNLSRELALRQPAAGILPGAGRWSRIGSSNKK